MSKLGKYLKRLREGKVEEVPVSLRTAADGASKADIKINYQTLANYEEGNTSRYDANVLKALADYYEVSYEDMFKHM
jgi:transcriptional regulator with XRE-family HTH domain